MITRNLKKSGSTPLKFHRKERLHVVSIAAGMVHSMALTEDGALFYWISSDPDLRCQQVLFLLIPFFTYFTIFLGQNMLIRNISLSSFLSLNFFCTVIYYVWKKYGEHICWKVLDCSSYSYR